MTSTDQRRAAFLAEMGVGPIWVHRSSVASMASLAEGDVDLDVAPVDHPVIDEKPLTSQRAEPAQPVPEKVVPVRVSTPSSSNTESAWDDDVVSPPPPRASRPAQVIAADNDIAAMDWTQLKSTVAACTKCGLCHNRTRTVFGVGDQKAKWLFVGEGPGRNEDAQGEPFVGPAGKLLDNMLLAMGLKRGENAYIANVVKCRPTDPNGRDRPPTPEESAACMPYLERQIALIQPTVIVALGKTAALALLKLDPSTPVSKLRGTVHRFASLPLIVTYHPAYLLRSLTEKRKAWADLCLAMETYASAD